MTATISAQRVDLFGVPVDPAVSAESLSALLRKGKTLRSVGFIGPHAWAIAKKNAAYLEALQSLTVNVAERPEIAWLCRQLKGQPCAHFNFDMHPLKDSLFKTMISEGLTLMLIGGKPGYDEIAKDKLEALYPGLKVLATMHGYDDFEPKLAAVAAKAPDVVLVDMGAPRQEMFLQALAKAGYKGLAIACGGFIENHLSEGHFYPHWVEAWKLHSVWRLYKTPANAWKKRLYEYGFFVVQAGRAFVEKYRPSPAPQS